MRPPSNAALCVLIAAVMLTVLVVIGSPHDRKVPAPLAPPAIPPTSVTQAGFTLTSASIDLPADDARFPPGPGAEVADRVCTACHSASMVLTQPPLTSEQWTVEIKKMADTYKASITPEDGAAIHAYLVGLKPAGALADPAGSRIDAAPAK